MQQAFQPHTLNWKRLQDACREIKKIIKFLNNIDIETPEQLAFLQEKNCDLYRGYIKSPPLPAEALVERFQEQGFN
jgi:hypothetical protein